LPVCPVIYVLFYFQKALYMSLINQYSINKKNVKIIQHIFLFYLFFRLIINKINQLLMFIYTNILNIFKIILNHLLTDRQSD